MGDVDQFDLEDFPFLVGLPAEIRPIIDSMIRNDSNMGEEEQDEIITDILGDHIDCLERYVLWKEMLETLDSSDEKSDDEEDDEESDDDADDCEQTQGHDDLFNVSDEDNSDQDSDEESDVSSEENSDDNDEDEDDESLWSDFESSVQDEDGDSSTEEESDCEEVENPEMLSDVMIAVKEEYTCCVCFGLRKEFAMCLKCKHWACCSKCVRKMERKSKDDVRCPRCRASFENGEGSDYILSNSMEDSVTAVKKAFTNNQ